MLKIGLIAYAAVFFSAAVGAQTVMDSTGQSIPPDLLNKVLTVVSDKLRDPETSRFRRLSKGTATALPAICGEVNGKNGMGAYSGYSAFIFFIQTGQANVYDIASDAQELASDLTEVGCVAPR